MAEDLEYCTSFVVPFLVSSFSSDTRRRGVYPTGCYTDLEIFFLLLSVCCSQAFLNTAKAIYRKIQQGELDISNEVSCWTEPVARNSVTGPKASL